MYIIVVNNHIHKATYLNVIQRSFVCLYIKNYNNTLHTVKLRNKGDKYK